MTETLASCFITVEGQEGISPVGTERRPGNASSAARGKSSHGGAAEAYGQLIAGLKLVVIETGCLSVTSSPIGCCRP